MMDAPKSIFNFEMQDNFIELLSEVPLFNDLNFDELSMLEDHMNVMDIEKDAILFQEGEEGDYVCFVLEGCLEVVRKTKGNNNIVIATLSKGDTIGEMSILDQIVRSATIRAYEKSKVVSLTSSDFEHILNEYPKIGVKILKGISRYMSLNMRRTSKLFVDLSENYISLLENYRTTF